ncbi:hypothetical protein [Rufibacter quisquiliarum]|uniref:Flagellar biosynthesis/type III secretory pathway M-ring protein FliF/YscJ n=1 Tax=Rufibacter quisquiliarum TaxID=1549639 RepID=A0A839GVQ1_9BACT|nr:hypothetical protein [Rufibacter quisquiliarum]MBA9078947.1 flagellar biosynthesis/type III secretory pathway M-ring protein FliF/YscJ [Rufibacter quisquiliarum]
MQVWNFGAYGSVLVILVLVIRSMMKSFTNNIDRREQAQSDLFGKSIEAITEHTKVLRELSEQSEVRHQQTIKQIRRSEGNVKRHIDKHMKPLPQPKAQPATEGFKPAVPVPGQN